MTRVAPVVALLLFACAKDVDGPAGKTTSIERHASHPSPAPIRTDRKAYRVTNGPQGPETTIVATLHAPDDRAVYIVNCNGATGTALQRKVGDAWVNAWVIAMNACLSPPIVLEPGGEHAARIYVHERSGGVLHPEGATMIESGTYRVMWTGVLTSFDPDVRGFGPELPLEQRVSAPITIEVPAAQGAPAGR
jgi:hypothetical protein